MFPPCADAIARAINRPSPILCPGLSPRPRASGSNTNGRTSGGIATSIMEAERHGVAVSVRGDRDGRSLAVLYPVANQIRYELGQPVAIPLASQVSVRLQPHDCPRLTGTDLNHRLLAHLL